MRRFTPAVTSMSSSRYSTTNLEPTHNIWGPTTPLKPSMSIWGFNALPYVHRDVATHEWDYAPPMVFHPSSQSVPMHHTSTGIPIKLQNQPQYSVTSSPSSLSSNGSQIWNDDFLYTPPLSPKYGSQTTATAYSRDYTQPQVSPISTPSFNSEPVFKENVKEFIECPELVNQGSKESLSPTPSSERLVISCSTGPLYVVQFKGNRRDIYTAPGTNSYSTGDAIMVDADRGRDLGVIIQANISRHDAAALKQMQHESRQHILQSTNHTNDTAASPDLGPSVYTPKQILSKATSSEIKDLASKIEDENAAVEFCNKKVAERMLDMVIVDAEYQWDRKKLTFFYTANNRVDFRSLVRELFRIYKTRIWMCATTVGV